MNFKLGWKCSKQIDRTLQFEPLVTYIFLFTVMIFLQVMFAKFPRLICV